MLLTSLVMKRIWYSVNSYNYHAVHYIYKCVHLSWMIVSFDQYLPTSVTTALLFVSLSLAVLDSNYKLYHTVFVFP